jgi:heat shock protein HslJ
MIITFGGCSLFNGKDDDTQTAELLDIVSFSWILESFEIKNVIIEIPQNQIYTLEFLEEPVHHDIDSFNLRIRADCNECWSNFHIFDNGQIAIDPLVCTEMYCGAESFDGQFTHALQNAFEYETEDQWTLRIFFENGDDPYALRFRRVEK